MQRMCNQSVLGRHERSLEIIQLKQTVHHRKVNFMAAELSTESRGCG
jgi:hypothetical protein